MAIAETSALAAVSDVAMSEEQCPSPPLTDKPTTQSKTYKSPKTQKWWLWVKAKNGGILRDWWKADKAAGKTMSAKNFASRCYKKVDKFDRTAAQACHQDALAFVKAMTVECVFLPLRELHLSIGDGCCHACWPNLFG